MSSYPPLPPPPPGGDLEPSVAPDEPAPQGSAARVVLAGLVLLAVVSVVLLGSWAWLRTPGVCDTSTVESTRFGYCLAAPGWEYTNEQSGSELPYDELVHPDASSVRILAAEVGGGDQLDRLISQVRESEADEGVVLGEVSHTSVAGVPARQWDLSLESGDVQLQIREVVFVRNGTAWRIQLITDPEGFDTRLADFERILRSWTFR